ncbi:MAG: ABC transporter permease [Psychrilyobacter sp.]|uniref:ABC transporter permease n=1 Tax=Psychrilyobacter sp. TaxID=2586924 RepID=UPI003C776D4C
MLKYIIRRIIVSIFLLFVMSAMIYTIFAFAPGDPVGSQMDPNMTKAILAKLRAQYGLDQPIYKRYFYWLWSAIHGDLGYSIQYSKSAVEVIKTYMWNSFILAVPALIISNLIAIPLGVISAVKHNTYIDKIIGLITLAGISCPSFFIALLVIKKLAMDYGIFPFSGMITAGAGYTGMAYFFDLLHHAVLPLIVMVSTGIAGMVMFVRSFMLNVLSQDYVRTARAKGLPQRTVIYKHAFKNTLIPIVTMFSGILGGLFGGSIVIESMFAWPGMGTIALGAVTFRDYPLIMATNIFFATLMLLGYLISDIVYGVVDPRVKLD